MTAIDSPRSSSDTWDLIVLPSMQLVTGITEDNVGQTLQSLVQDTQPMPSGVQVDALRTETGSVLEHLVMVCCHLQRDQRCGVLGPMIVKEMNKVLEEKQMKQNSKVYRCSHVGGTYIHMYVCILNY